MNKDITILIINSIHSQQILNNQKETLRKIQYPFIDSSFVKWFVEKMLNGYNAVYKYVTVIDSSNQRFYIHHQIRRILYL